MSAQAPKLVIAYGNPSRGDDAAGPLLAERLVDWLEKTKRHDVEVLCDFQLNIEHLLDLQGRERVLIIDATCAPNGEVRLRRLVPKSDHSHTTHAVSPGGLLATFETVMRTPSPVTELLTVPAMQFELGDPISEATRMALEVAWNEVTAWCAA